MKLISIAAALTLASTSPAFAQATNTATGTTDPYATAAQVEDNDDDGGKWGLLGLLGLAGLLGLKRRDRDDHVRTTGTGTNDRR